MFSGCLSLKELNLSGFNTKKVIMMNYMFSKCSDELKLKLRSRYKNFYEKLLRILMMLIMIRVILFKMKLINLINYNYNYN